MRIKYLKTTEEFELTVPDPIYDGEVLTVKISDYDLINLIKTGQQNNLDDDTFLGIKNLRANYNLTERVIKLAKRQYHLRKLNRTDTAWLELKPRRHVNPRHISEEQLERLEYLRNNESQIVKNCLKHDWFTEYYKLMRDLHPELHKTEIIEQWRNLKNSLL